MSIEGNWNAQKLHCSCGYTAIWTITMSSDSNIVVKEQPGSRCCMVVPNLFLKTHNLKKVEEGKWEGKLGFKPIRLEVKSDKELYHLTTDGPLIMTRS